MSTPLPARVYLDNAATSFPKPEQVYQAVDHYHREWGAAVGRGSTRIGAEVQRVIDRCRSRAARLFGLSESRNVIFTFNGTDSLNLAIHGLLNQGENAVTTVWEHNSVLRPLETLKQTDKVSTTIIPDDGTGLVNLEEYEKSLRTHPRLVILNHASNVTGIVQNVKLMAEMAHQVGALILLDAAQTAGHRPVTFAESGADLIACPGHKGLLGPLGTGLLLIRPGLENQLRPARQGGTGTTSESPEQPHTLPERFEAGNHNAPGLCGLEAALAWHEERLKSEDSTSQQSALMKILTTGLRFIPRLRLFPEHDQHERVDLVSLTLDGIEPHVLAQLLDEHFGIETRAGLHCAPLAHQALGTLESGGTVRLSPGPWTTAEQIDLTLEALAQIATAM